MQPAMFIARLIGPLFVVVGIGVMLNHALYAAMVADAVRIPALIYLTGLMSLTAGIAILNAHRAWSADWHVVVTVLGWLFVFAGVMRIVLPQASAIIAARLYTGSTVMALAGVLVLAVGGFLCFQGYRR